MDKLNLLYTGNIRGDLHGLPRLYTCLQQLRQQFPAEDGGPLLLDLGDACAPDVWHCAATGGRSVLIVLDGMGYHAAHVVLDESERHKLHGVTTLGLVDARRNWRYHVPPVRDDGIVVSAQPTPALRLNIVLTPADTSHLSDGTLQLQAVDKGQIGRVQLDLSDAPRLLSAEIVSCPSGLRPDVTIAAAVDFVEEEARHAQRQRGD